MNQTEFKQLVWDYYHKHGRDLPWRRTRDPYAIFVSEVMLQQTQVSRVLVKFPQLMSQFPDFATLAVAPVSAVVTAWQGMGYNRRALWLKRAAEVIMSDYNGQLPKDASELIKLPGIGPNTAGSITAFAFNAPAVFIETNIRRVFIHCFFSDGTNVCHVELKRNISPTDERSFVTLRMTNVGAVGVNRISDAQIRPLIEKTLDRDNPREWYFALMDYGSVLPKFVANPNRRSRHYAKQSTFEGSHRQKRAEVLKALVDKAMSMDELSNRLHLSNDATSRVVEELVNEGFIEAGGGIYSLVS